MKSKGLEKLTIGLASLYLLAGCDALISTDGRLDRARDAMNAGQFGRASIELRKVVDKEPANPKARLLMARLALRMNDAPGAEAEINRAEDAKADPAAIQSLRIEATLQAGKAEEASARIQASKLLAQPARGVLLGKALLAQGKPAEALAAFESALAVERGNAAALAGKAGALMTASKIDEANAAADAALAADAKNWEAALIKSRLLQAKGDQRAAQASIRQALEHMAAGGATLRQIADARIAVTEMALGTQDVITASKDAELLRQLIPDSPLMEYEAARLSVAKGDRREAVAALQKIVLGSPDMIPARFLLGTLLMAEGDLVQAEGQFQTLVGQDPQNLEARKQLAQIRLQLGNPDGAASALTPALVANKTDARLFQLMIAAVRGDSRGETLPKLRRAYEDAPQNPGLRLAYAEALIEAKRPAEALALVSANTPVGDASHYWTIRFAASNAVRGAAATRKEAESLVESRPSDIALITTAAAFFSSQADMTRARDTLQKGLRAEPKAVSLILALAQINRLSGNGPAADKVLADALVAQPDALQVRQALAEAQAEHNDLETAIATLRAASKVEDNTELQFTLARFELSRGNLANAQKALNRVFELSPGNADMAYRAGSMLVQAHQLDAALPHLQKAVELAPTSPNYQIALASVQLQRGEVRAARRAAERAIQLDPKSQAPVSTLIAIEIRDKNNTAAVQLAQDWQQRHTEDPTAKLLLAETLVAVQRTPDAATVYAELQQSHPSAEIAARLHQLLAANHDAKAAEPLLAWLKTTPNDQRLRMLLASYYSGISDWARAAAEYEKIIAAFPNDPAALNNLAVAYQGMKDSRALATAEKAYAVAGQSFAVSDTLGWILVERGDVQRGLTLLQKAATTAADSSEIQLHYGVALSRAGQKKEALAVLQKAAASEKDPGNRNELQKQIDQLRSQP